LIVGCDSLDNIETSDVTKNSIYRRIQIIIMTTRTIFFAIVVESLPPNEDAMSLHCCLLLVQGALKGLRLNDVKAQLYNFARIEP
jgi:hypothetical protein